MNEKLQYQFDSPSYQGSNIFPKIHYQFPKRRYTQIFPITKPKVQIGDMQFQSPKQQENYLKKKFKSQQSNSIKLNKEEFLNQPLNVIFQVENIFQNYVRDKELTSQAKDFINKIKRNKMQIKGKFFRKKQKQREKKQPIGIAQQQKIKQYQKLQRVQRIQMKLQEFKNNEKIRKQKQNKKKRSISSRYLYQQDIKINPLNSKKVNQKYSLFRINTIQKKQKSQQQKFVPSKFSHLLIKQSMIQNKKYKNLKQVKKKSKIIIKDINQLFYQKTQQQLIKLKEKLNNITHVNQTQ